MGQYDETTALKIIRTICYDTPGALLGMKPADCLAAEFRHRPLRFRSVSSGFRETCNVKRNHGLRI